MSCWVEEGKKMIEKVGWIVFIGSMAGMLLLVAWGVSG
jgi:hypothetical protein